MRRVHRVIDERQNGPHPGGEPMRPGEATQEQGVQKGSFLRYFVEELGNQALGQPTPDEHIGGGNSLEETKGSKPGSSPRQREETKKWGKKRG